MQTDDRLIADSSVMDMWPCKGSLTQWEAYCWCISAHFLRFSRSLALKSWQQSPLASVQEVRCVRFPHQLSSKGKQTKARVLSFVDTGFQFSEKIYDFKTIRREIYSVLVVFAVGKLRTTDHFSKLHVGSSRFRSVLQTGLPPHTLQIFECYRRIKMLYAQCWNKMHFQS